MDKLVTEWQEIIDEVYETGNHEDFDELLITFAAAYRVMFNNMYICHGELRDSFVDFLCTNQNIKEVSDYICYLLTDVAKPSEEIPEFNITWNNTIQEVTSNNDIDEALLSGSTDVMSLFCERGDTCDSDEDEEVDEEESEAEVEEVPERIDAEEMARTFVEKYKQDHPDLSNNRGYVQPSESVGAPSGENPFRETSEGNTEPVNSEEAESSHSDVTGGNGSDESVNKDAHLADNAEAVHGTESIDNKEIIYHEAENSEEKDDLGKMPPEKKFVKKDVSYFDDAAFIGDSRVVGIKLYSGIENGAFYCKEGLTVYNMFEEPLEMPGGSKETLENALTNNQYKKIYLENG